MQQARRLQERTPILTVVAHYLVSTLAMHCMRRQSIGRHGQVRVVGTTGGRGEDLQLLVGLERRDEGNQLK